MYGPSFELVLAKELTKTFEYFMRGTPAQVIAWLLETRGHEKGEFVLILPARVQSTDAAEHIHCLTILLAELPLKQAVKLAAEITGVHKNELYTCALQHQKRGD